MGISGKYDFRGIKRYGARGLEVALASTAWGAALLKMPVIGNVLSASLELFVNWLANKGLLVLNLAAISIEGEFDQKSFDAAMDEALGAVALGKLTPKQQKEIDDKVIVAFRRFAKLSH